MKATKAYIASLGTTGVLLGAAILMLAVVSAVVAFDRWPGGNVPTRVHTLVLAEKPAPIRVSAHAAAPGAGRGQARAPAPAPGRTRLGILNAGGVAGQRFSSGQTAPAATAKPAPTALTNATKPLQPVQDTAAPIIDSISNPGSTAGAVADSAQSVTDTAGGSTGRIDPQLGGAISGTGQTLADAIRSAPLPDHVLPGY